MRIEQSVFNFVDQLAEARSLNAIEQLFWEFTQPFGIEFYMFGQLAMAGGEIKTVRLFCAETHPWFKHYAKAHLYLDDPVTRLAKSIPHAFTWSWLLEHAELTNAERRVFDEAARFGLSDGLFIPIHGPNGSLAGGSVAGPDFQINRSATFALTMMAQAAHQRALEISGFMDANFDNPLSLRQRECLNWAQHGKSVQEIAKILTLSPHTVKEHLDAAKVTLGVNTRIEAIVKARNANYIGISPSSDKQNKLPRD